MPTPPSGASEATRGGREWHLQANGPRRAWRDAHSTRPDLSAWQWRYTRPPVGQSQLQLWDVKTSGVMPRYYSNFSVPPLDQRARLVPGDCQQKVVECDHDWNGMAPGLTGAFGGYLALLPPLMGLGFRGWGEWGSLLGGCPHREECRRKSF